MLKNLRHFTAAAPLAVLFAFSAAPVRSQEAPAPAPPAAPGAPPGPDIAADLPTGPIQVADVLSVLVLGEDKIPGQYRVDNNGNISLPLAGVINVQGKLPTDAAAAIAQTLIDKKLLKRPQVTVYIASRPARTVVLSGAVSRQGRVAVREGSHLSDILEPAGLGANSDLSKVVITRGNEQIPVNYQAYHSGKENSPAVNPVVQDGDKIFVYAVVAPAGAFRLFGEVKSSGQVTLTEGTTVGQAIQQAGGVTESADREGIFIQRGETRIPVPLKEIQAGDTSKDIALQSGDEINVPKLERPKSYTVAGAVNAQGRYPLLTKTTYQQALTQAGGYVEGARLKETELTRTLPDGTIEKTTIDLTNTQVAAMEVQEGDLIRIPPARNRPPINAFNILGALSSVFFLLRR